MGEGGALQSELVRIESRPPRIRLLFLFHTSARPALDSTYGFMSVTNVRRIKHNTNQHLAEDREEFS